MTVGQEIEPAPQRWKASALTTATTNPAPLKHHDQNAKILTI